MFDFLKYFMALRAKTEEELELMRKSALLVSRTHAEVAKLIRPGITGKALDKVAFEFIKDHGATPSFLNYGGFPASLCISVNEVVVHGIPDDVEYKSGDIVSIDCGTILSGYHGDMAYTYAIGEVDAAVQQLMRVTKESLYLGIAKAITNNRVGDISSAIQEYCERGYGYGIVRELVGHGVGSQLHEEPQVPNYGRKGDGKKLITNLTIAIEPMVNMGTKDVYTREDKWTVATEDDAPSAHFEHTVCIKPNKAEILTTFDFIEEAVRNNKELIFI